MVDHEKNLEFMISTDFQIPRTNNTLKGTESVRYFGSVI